MKNNNYLWLIFISTLFLSSSTILSQILSQNSRVAWSSFNVGFAKFQTSNTIVNSVAGQNFVGTSLLGNAEIISGFLADTLFRTVITAVHDQEGLPSTYSLAQNYPNPFNPSTSISYQLPRQSYVTLIIYNILGREIATLVDEMKQPGKYFVQWNASDIPTGVYFYRLVTGNYVQTKKLVLMK